MRNVFGRLKAVFTSAFDASFALLDFTVVAAIIIWHGRIP